MLEMPAATAVTTPVPPFTVATEVLLLIQLPPEVPLEVYVAVAPIQSGVMPLSVPALTFGLTVKVLPADTGLWHPVLTV